MKKSTMVGVAKRLTRRQFILHSGAVFAGAHVAPQLLGETVADLSDIRLLPVRNLLSRILGSRANQITVRLTNDLPAEEFHIAGRQRAVEIEGTSISALLVGVHWYLKNVAGVCISWNGDSLSRLPAKLPIPLESIRKKATVPHRFALNDTNDAYTGPYWDWGRWERFIDILALHGINEVLVYLGSEAVYQQTFECFHYSRAELQKWFPTAAHQPWWLLQNLSSVVGPELSQQQIDARLRLAARVTSRLRDLAIQPVLPGYYGMVPPSFAEKNSGARVVDQGEWQGMKRPDWLDPTSPLFADVARTYYEVQERLLGPASMFKMDPMHEGGRAAGLDIGTVASSIERQLQTAHPGAVWVVIGWQSNPKPAFLAGISDKSRLLILDGIADRYVYRSREVEWSHTPYTFAPIWNFGGHTAIGANMAVWNQRFFDQRDSDSSCLRGIAVIPEASCNNPAAFAFLTDLPWLDQRPDLASWFRQWSAARYGGESSAASEAWNVLRSTAYDGQPNSWSEPHDNLFSARPSLTATKAAGWSPEETRYDISQFENALGLLMKVDVNLRHSSAYRYDLVDIARQVISNDSRVYLPLIREAYGAKEKVRFIKLTRLWLETITMLDEVTACDDWFQLGPWLANAKAVANNEQERLQLEFDACSILLEWGPASSRNSEIHDYANREWNGLLPYYHRRWESYFKSLLDALDGGYTPVAIDWFDMDQDWAREEKQLRVDVKSNAYEVIEDVLRRRAEMKTCALRICEG